MEPRWLTTLVAAVAIGIGILLVRSPLLGWSLALACFGTLAIVLVSPRSWVVLLLGAAAAFTGSTYGLEAGTGETLFSRGSGIALLPVFELAVIGVAIFQAITKPRRGEGVHPIGVFLSLLVGLYLVHLIVAVVSGNALEESLAGSGGRLLLTLLAAYMIFAHGVRGENDFRVVWSIVLFAGTLVALWGLGRYAFASGDPANPYRLYSGLEVKLTYFEAAYSFFLAAVFFWGLVRPATGKRWTRILIRSLSLLSILTLLLSFRRTNWLGVVLGLVLIGLFKSKRVTMTLALLGLTLFALLILAPQRDLPRLGLGPSRSAESARLEELDRTVAAIAQSPLGLGPSGSYGDALDNWPAPPTIVHNAFLWTGLKLGVLGALLLLGAFGSALLGLFREARRGRTDGGWFITTGLAGFWAANLMFGTPILETRLTLLFGGWLALVAFRTRHRTAIAS